MIRYVILGKYSQDFLSGLIYNPQDRKKAAAAMMKKAGAEWAEGESYLHINHPNYDFVGIVYSEDESTMKASADMMRATGSFTDINFFRAWIPEEYTEISKKASELVGLYAAPSEYKED